jgi:hypothetical protein
LINKNKVRLGRRRERQNSRYSRILETRGTKKEFYHNALRLIIAQAAGISTYSVKCRVADSVGLAYHNATVSRRKDDIPCRVGRSSQWCPMRLKIGRRRLRETSLGEVQKESGGGEEEGRESPSEQKDPLREESEERMGRPPDMLKYLLSWATAELISGFRLSVTGVLAGEEKPQVSELPLFPPNMGSCLTGPLHFFSGVATGLLRASSSACTKWQRGPYGQNPTLW